MPNLEKRWLSAKDYTRDPSLLDPYPHKYVLLADRSGDISHQNLLIAIEQMETRGWTLNNVTCLGDSALMYALMSRRR